MALQFDIPGRFHPGHALLGRWLRRSMGDPRRAEAWHLIVLTGTALALLLTQYLTWAWLGPVIEANPTSPMALAFWTAQVGAVALIVLLGAVGFQPPIRVTCTPEDICFRQAEREHRLALGEIEAVEMISALRFHRHERRYAATVVFVNRLEAELLLLHTAGGPVVLGLAPPDRATLRPYLEGHHVPAVHAHMA